MGSISVVVLWYRKRNYKGRRGCVTAVLMLRVVVHNNIVNDMHARVRFGLGGRDDVYIILCVIPV